MAGSWPAGRENPRGNFSGAGPFLWMGLLFFFSSIGIPSRLTTAMVGVRRGPSPSSSCNNPPDIGIDLAFLAFPLALRCAAVRRGRSTWSRPRHLEMVTPLELRRGRVPAHCEPPRGPFVDISGFAGIRVVSLFWVPEKVPSVQIITGNRRNHTDFRGAGSSSLLAACFLFKASHRMDAAYSGRRRAHSRLHIQVLATGAVDSVSSP